MSLNKTKATIYGIYQIMLIEIRSMITVMRISKMRLPNEEKRTKINEVSLMKLQSVKSVLYWLSLID